MTRTRKAERASSRGQVLALFSLMLVVLLGMATLAVDLSSVLAARRGYQAAADAAALAGAQDLQGTRRAVTSANQSAARQHALQVLRDRLGGGATACPTTVDLTDCALAGSPFKVSIKTPSPTCATCDPTHAIQVTVVNSAFGLSFARIFGRNAVAVGVTAVGGLSFSSTYSLVVLRPPAGSPNGTDNNKQDIDVNGSNTTLTLIGGDIGTNTSAFTNSSGKIVLDPGYVIHHRDDITPDPWNKDLAGNPKGVLLDDLLPDPNYPTPSRSGAPTFASQSAGEDPTCAGAPTGIDALPAGSKCYRPGIYLSAFNVQGSLSAAYLESGVYFFDSGADVRTQLLGGVVSGRSGVLIVVPQTQTFTGNSAQKIWLNTGGSSCSDDTCRAGAASDASGNVMQTAAGLLLSLEVTRTPTCFNGVIPQLCGNDNGNGSLRIPGNGQIRVAGVVYAPSDKVRISGDNSNQVGTIGQLVVWTLTVSGGAKLNQEAPGAEQVGIVRLDAACTAPSTPCNNP